MNKILFLDTLTTGMNPQRCAIYAIGGIICEDSAQGTNEIRRFELHIKPYDGARIYENSLWIGNMTRTRLVHFPKEEDALKDLISLLNEQVKLTNPYDKIYLSGFNASSFDLPFLKEMFERNGNRNFFNYFHMQTLDIMNIAAFALMNERNRMPDFHLHTAARYLGVINEIGEQYNCLYNAETCLKMFRVLKERFHIGIGGEEKPAADIFRNTKI